MLFYMPLIKSSHIVVGYNTYKKLFALNATAQSDFIAQFPDSDILANKLVVFKGHTIYGDLNLM